MKLDRPFILALLAVLALGAIVATRIDVTTDMTRFMPSGEARQQADLMRQFANSRLSRTMILLLHIDAAAPHGASEVSRAMESELRQEPALTKAVAFIEGGPPTGVDRAFWELYQPRRLAFLAPSPEQAAARLTDSALATAAEKLKDRLATPMSALVSRAAPGDPLMVTAGMLDALQPTQAAALAIDDGRFSTSSGKAAVLFLGTHASAFDATTQAEVLDGIAAAFDRTNAAFGDTLQLRQAGVNRIAVAAQRAIKGDIQRVSVLSVVSVVAVFLILFGSLRLVAVTLVPITAGMLAGLAGCALLFGTIHGLTLAFGAALIGVCIDYCAHTYCHHQLEPSETGAHGTVRRVWSGLALGAMTTITGFVALSWATFPGLKEVGVFGALGVAGALGATRWLVPPLMGRGHSARRPLRALAESLDGWLAQAQRRRGLLIILPLACLIVVGVGVPRMSWNDDLSQFGRVDGPLMDEDREVREKVAPFEQRRFVLSVGPDEESALRANDAVAQRLAQAQRAGEIASYRSIATLLPSATTQQAVADKVASDATLWERMRSAFEGAGFSPAAFEPFRKHLAAPQPAPLTFDDLSSSPLGPLVRPFRLTLGDQTAFVSFLTGVKDASGLQRRVAGIDGVQVLDFGAIMTAAYGGYRQRMIELLLLGLGVVLLLLAARYRRPRLVIAALAPSLLAAATTLSVLTLLGMPLSVLTVTALLMVVCMGVDYGVFLTETVTAEVTFGPTMAALVVAAVSTLAGFGLLALSDHPSLQSLGLTAAVGVATSVLLAPTALVLVAHTPSQGDESDSAGQHG